MWASFSTRRRKGKGKEEKGRNGNGERGWVREWWKGKEIELKERVINGKEKGEIYRGRDRGKWRKRERR